MKKILHVLRSKKFSGAENVAINIISNLSGEYNMYYVSPEGPIKNTLAERNINYIPMKNLSLLNLFKVVKDNKPDIIHAHDFTATILSAMVSFNTPVVSQIHQYPNWLNKICIRSILFLIVSIKVSQFIVVTPAINNSLIFKKFLKRKTKVIENMVDLNVVREKSRVPTDLAYDIIFLGRLVDVKDPIRFINIISKVIKKRPSTKVAIIGDGYLKEECESLIKKLKLKGNIDLLGFVSNPFPILMNSKVLCMTSKSEGLPMTIIESLSLGKPVIASDLDGIANIVDNTCGILCKTDEQFILSIIQLLNDDKLYKNMSKSAKEKVESLFNLTQYKEDFVEVYTRC